MSGNIVVAVRIRPLSVRERQQNCRSIAESDGPQIVLQTPKAVRRRSSQAATEAAAKPFTFDFCYNSTDPESTDYAGQAEIHANLGQELLSRAFSGYNCCILAYGQTGSGKTHTMMGDDLDKGLIPRICEALFERVAKMTTEALHFSVEASYLEIYSERVRDLLSPNTQISLRVREHPKTGPYVEGLVKQTVHSYQDMAKLMEEGNRRRTTASTRMNDSSSRSHAIFSILLTQKQIVAGIETERFSRISLVDLAGSERAESTGAVGVRLKEGADINRSLTTLGRVISILVDKQSRRKSSSTISVPYRDSVLTWLLKDSIGGNSSTAMIATVSPADIHHEESLSTLRYAYSAKRIQNHPLVNEDENTKLIRELQAELAELRARVNISSPEAKVQTEFLAEQTLTITAPDGSLQHFSKAEIAERLAESNRIMAEWDARVRRDLQEQKRREEGSDVNTVGMGKIKVSAGTSSEDTPEQNVSAIVTSLSNTALSMHDLDRLDDSDIESLFENVNRVKARRKIEQSAFSTPERHDSAHSLEDSQGPPSQQHYSFLDESPTTTRSQTVVAAPRPYRFASIFDSPSQPSMRRHDREQLIQSLNAESLEAEARGQIASITVLERLATAKKDAASSIERQREAFDHAVNIDLIVKAKLIKRTLDKWTRFKEVSIARQMVRAAHLLGQAQLAAMKAKLDLTFQFAILDSLVAPVSPNEDDRVYDSLSQSLELATTPFLCIRINDRIHNAQYFWSLQHLKQRIDKFHTQKSITLLERPFPTYTLIGQGILALIPTSGELKQSVDIFSPVHVHCGILHVQTSLRALEVPETASLYLKIESLRGVSEKEVSELHIHSFFGKDLDKRLTTESKSGFGFGPVIFGSEYICEINATELPDAMFFQVYGVVTPEYLLKLCSWDDLQESIPARAALPRLSSNFETIIMRTQITELDPEGTYQACELYANSEASIGVARLHQGLTRRLKINILDVGNDPLIAVSIGDVEVLQLGSKRDRKLSRERHEETDLKIISTKQITPAQLEIIAHWDSSIGVTKALDRVTPADKVARVSLSVTFETATLGQIQLHDKILLRVEGRDHQIGIISRLFSAEKSLAAHESCFKIPRDQASLEAHRRAVFNAFPEQTQEEAELLAGWRPRGVSLVQEYRKMSRTRANTVALQETRLRYMERQLAPPSAPRSSEDALPLVRDIARYWQLRTRANAPTENLEERATRLSPREWELTSVPRFEPVKLADKVDRADTLSVLDRVGGTWTKRYCVLRDGHLLEYDGGASSSSRLLVAVTDLATVRCSTDGAAAEPVRASCFTLTSDARGGSGNATTFRAPSEAARRAWVEAIAPYTTGSVKVTSS